MFITMSKQCEGAPARGDVVGVTDTPEGTEIRLHEHPVTYIVSATPAEGGPAITRLTVQADDGAAVDYPTVRAIPLRRLAATAARRAIRELHAAGIDTGRETRKEVERRPETADDRAFLIAQLVHAAQEQGRTVRRYVQDQTGYSPATIDRLIRRAKDERWLDDHDLLSRPQPRQRDHTTEDRDR
ncbi:hypothetical protein [Tsukamurella sp. USMM236]